VNLEGLLLACAFHGEAVAGREFGADDDIKGLQIIVGSLGFQAEAGVALHQYFLGAGETF
jgi:hypothetical protein